MTIFLAVLSLRCRCENSRLCTGDVDICEQNDAVCLVKVSSTGYEYACWERDVPHDYFGHDCLDGKLIGEHSITICCNDGDFCNMDLRPTLPSVVNQGDTTTALQTTSSEPSAQTTMKRDGMFQPILPLLKELKVSKKFSLFLHCT